MPCLRCPIPCGLLLVAVAGGIHQQQRDVIDYLQAENRVLREQLGPRRVRFTDDQRVRLAAKAKELSRHVLTEIGAVVTSDTLLAWHRRLIARKYDARQPAPSGGPRHQGVGNQLLFPEAPTIRGHGPIACRPRLGGFLKYYHRPAA